LIFDYAFDAAAAPIFRLFYAFLFTPPALSLSRDARLYCAQAAGASADGREMSCRRTLLRTIIAFLPPVSCTCRRRLF